MANGAGAYGAFPVGPEAYRDATRDVTLKRLFQAAVARAEEQMDWFDRNASMRARSAKRIRKAALILFAAGTLAPITLALLVKLATAYPDGKPDIKSTFELLQRLPLAEVGYVLLAIAGAIIIFDNFFDTSGSWIRFRQSQARLAVILADFRFEWAKLMAQSGGVIPATAFSDGGQGAKLTTLLSDFIKKVESVVEEDTREWARRFAANIQRFDENPDLKMSFSDKAEKRAEEAAAKPSAAEAGVTPADRGAGAQAPAGAPTVTVRVAIADFASLEPGSLSLRVNESDLPAPTDGFTEIPVEVGLDHRVVARGTRAGLAVRGELPLSPTLNDENSQYEIVLN